MGGFSSYPMGGGAQVSPPPDAQRYQEDLLQRRNAASRMARARQYQGGPPGYVRGRPQYGAQGGGGSSGMTIQSPALSRVSAVMQRRPMVGPMTPPMQSGLTPPPSPGGGGRMFGGSMGAPPMQSGAVPPPTPSPSMDWAGSNAGISDRVERLGPGGGGGMSAGVMAPKRPRQFTGGGGGGPFAAMGRGAEAYGRPGMPARPQGY